MMKLQFHIDGMHCEACVQRVTRALSQVPGTQVDEVSVGAARLDSTSADLETYLAAIRKAGYEGHLVE